MVWNWFKKPEPITRDHARAEGEAITAFLRPLWARYAATLPANDTVLLSTRMKTFVALDQSIGDAAVEPGENALTVTVDVSALSSMAIEDGVGWFDVLGTVRQTLTADEIGFGRVSFHDDAGQVYGSIRLHADGSLSANLTDQFGNNVVTATIVSSTPPALPAVTADSAADAWSFQEAKVYSGGVVTAHAHGLPDGTRVAADPSDPASWRTSVSRAPTAAERRGDDRVAAAPPIITGEQVGTIFGSTLGQALGGGTVAGRIAAGTALSAVLGNVGEGLHIYFSDTTLTEGSAQAASFGEALDTAFDDFSGDLAKSAAGAGPRPRKALKIAYEGG